MTLTEKSLSICKENYDKNCGGCPLRKACVKPSVYGQEGLNKWVEGVNELAESIVKG